MFSLAELGKMLQQRKENLSCNNADCRASGRLWKRVLDGAAGARLAGRSYCFPSCFEHELLRRFEQLRIAPPAQTSPRRRVPLGLLMLSRGDLDACQLRLALDAQRRNGYGQIGEWIADLGFARERQIISALGAQWSCPVLWNVPDRLAECDIPLPLLRRFRMAPVHYAKASRVMHVAFAGTVDYLALVAIEQVMQCRAEACITGSNALAETLARIEDSHRPSGHVFADAPAPEEMTRISSSYAARLRVNDVRLALCGEYIWLRLEAGTDSVNLLFASPIEQAPRCTRLASPRIELPSATGSSLPRPPEVTPAAACPSPGGA